MFIFTPVQVLSVVKIAPDSGLSARSALGARNNPATITAIDVNMCEGVFIVLLIYFFCCRGLIADEPLLWLQGGILSHLIKGTADRSSEKNPKILGNDHDKCLTRRQINQRALEPLLLVQIQAG